jgi:O-antigen/teichoic acid export membrane protein
MRTKRLLAGLGWNTAGQLLVVGITLGLTPFLLNHLGATQYGIFALVSSVRGFLSNMDAGLGPTGTRYFPVYVGRGNAANTTSFLLTMLVLVTIIVGGETVAIMLFAPTIVKLFSLGSGLAAYSHETVALLRDLMPALFIAAIRTPLQRLAMAHHRWAFINYTQVMAVVAYTITIVVMSRDTPGLKCLIWGTYAQEAVLLVTALWACRRYISPKGLILLPITEVRRIIRFGGRVQISAVASSFNYEIDALLVGSLFPVSDLAYYSIGVNFSQQVINMASNALNPIAQEIGLSYGRDGKQGVLRSFSGVQRAWVTAIGAFSIVAAVEGWFGIRVWIGQGSQLASATAVILVLGFAPLLLNSIVDVTAKIVEMPEIESWYLGIGVVLNVACTIPLALRVGVLGVPLGTAIGEVISFFACIWLARRKIGKEITPFFRDLKYVPVLVSVAVAIVCERIFRNSLPGGGIGFVLSGVLTLPAFVSYYGWVYREPLQYRFGLRVRPAAANIQTQVAEDDGAYAARQHRALRVLMALSEPADAAARQFRGLQMLMSLSEPETTVVPFSPEITAIPFSGSSVRLQYTGPLQRLDERPFDRPVQGRRIRS